MERLKFNIMSLFDKILLCNYSLSVLFSRKNKSKHSEGAFFLWAQEFFFVLLSSSIFVLNKFVYHLELWHGLVIIFFLSYTSFYSMKKHIMYHIAKKKNNICKQYKLLNNTLIYTFLGWMLFLGSYAFMFVVLIQSFR